MALGGAEASTDGTDDSPQHVIGLSAQVDRYFLQDPFSFFRFGPHVEPGTAASRWRFATSSMVTTRSLMTASVSSTRRA